MGAPCRANQSRDLDEELPVLSFSLHCVGVSMDNSTPVIVNRGWLPRKLLDQHIAGDAKEEAGEVSFVGVLRHGEEVKLAASALC